MFIERTATILRLRSKERREFRVAKSLVVFRSFERSQSRGNARVYKHFTPTGVKVPIATLVGRLQMTRHLRSLRSLRYRPQVSPDPDHA